jgi:hypothetical protein
MSKTLAALGLGLAGVTCTAAMAGNGYGYGYDNGTDSYGNGLYIGASVAEIFYKEQGLPTLVPSVGIFHLGEQFNPYLAIEGRLGAGFDGDGFRFYHVDVPVVYGGYVKGMLPVSPWFAAYAIAGVGGVQLHRNYPDYDSNDAAFSFGVGGEFTLYGGARIHAEWARLDSGNNDGYDYTVDQLSVGVNWHF